MPSVSMRLRMAGTEILPPLLKTSPSMITSGS